MRTHNETAARRMFPMSGYERFLNSKDMGEDKVQSFERFVMRTYSGPFYLLMGSELEEFHRKWKASQ